MPAHQQNVGAAFLPPSRAHIERILRYEDDVRLHAVYTALERHLSAGGQNMLSYRQIAELTIGVSPATVRRKIPRLLALGLIARHRQGRGAYCWEITKPKITPFCDATVNSREFMVSARALMVSTNINNNNNHISISLDEADISKLTPQRRYIYENIPGKIGEPLLIMADRLPLSTVKEKVELARNRKPSPAGFLYTCLEQELKPRPIPQEPNTKPREGADDKPRPLGGKYADWIET